MHFNMLFAISFNLDQTKIFSSGNGLTTLGKTPFKNHMGIGENAGNYHFLLYPAFNPFPNKPWFLPVFSTSLLKTLGKGEIARNKQFLLFPQCLLPVWRNVLPFSSNLKLSPANSLVLEESKLCHLGKG